jgi:hypothetical protein
MTYKMALNHDNGETIDKISAEKNKLAGCTLVWWQEGKVVRYHVYVQQKDCEK